MARLIISNSANEKAAILSNVHCVGCPFIRSVRFKSDVYYTECVSGTNYQLAWIGHIMSSRHIF